MKQILNKSIFLILTLILFEIVLRIFLPSDFLKNRFKNEVSIDLKKMNSLYTRAFCDPIHKTMEGEKITAVYIYEKLKLTNISLNNTNVLLAGGSTTAGFLCDSNTNWPNEINKYFTSLHYRNIAHDNATIESLYYEIQNQFTKKNKYNYIILASPSVDLGVKKNQQKSLFKKIVIATLIFDLKMQEILYFYKWLKTTFYSMSNYFAHSINSLIKTQDDSIKNYRAFIFNNILPEILNDQSIYIKKIADLAIKNNSKMICIKMPFVPNLQPETLLFSKSEFDFYNDITGSNILSICRKLGLPVIDVHQSFRNNL